MSSYPFDAFKKIVEVEPPAHSHAPPGTGARVALPNVPDRLSSGMACKAALAFDLPLHFRDDDAEAAARNAGHVANHLLELSEQMRANGALLDAPCLIVSDEEAEAAARTYLCFQLAEFGFRKDPWADMPESSRTMLTDHCKRSLAAGQFLDFPTGPEGHFMPELTHETRDMFRALQRMALQVARLAVLKRRAVRAGDAVAAAFAARREAAAAKV